MMERIINFLKKGIWDFPRNQGSRFVSFLVRALRVLIASTKAYFQDDCMNKASALTYYTLLSMAPVLAIAFAIAKGFGLESNLEEQINLLLLEYPEIATHIITFAKSYLTHVQGGIIGGTGIVVLLIVVMIVIGNIEHALNSIWKVKQPRSYTRKFSDYFAMVVVSVLILVASSGLTVFIMGNLIKATQYLVFMDRLSPVITQMFQLSPLLLSWLLFTMVYLIMPNTSVPFRVALIAGILAGTGYQISQWVYLNFQLGVSSYGAIYGSFAAIPLFLIWLHFSWMILLFGAEVAYHAEYDRYDFVIKAPQIQERVSDSKIFLYIWIVYRYSQAFLGQIPGFTIPELAQELGVSLPILREFHADLTQAGILVALRQRLYGDCYQIAQDPYHLTLKQIYDALNRSFADKLRITVNEDFEKIKRNLEQFNEKCQHLPENITISDLIVNKR